MVLLCPNDFPVFSIIINTFIYCEDILIDCRVGLYFLAQNYLLFIIQEAINCLEGLGVEVLPRTFEWAKERGMNAFLSVSRGSGEPPVFLELTYKGKGFDDEKPLAIVGEYRYLIILYYIICIVFLHHLSKLDPSKPDIFILMLFVVHVLY